MPLPSVPLRRLGFLTIGLFDGDDPAPGHESTLAVIELGEQLGFDSAWVRHRHLQYGISSPVAVLAAASQRTSRIELGTAVIPLGWENPLRLAEDLATVDLLSGGRLNPGRQRRPADALGRRQGRALPRHGRRRGLQLRAGRAAAARGARRAGQRLQRDGRHRGVLRPGPAALRRPRRSPLVRRRQPPLGPVGRRARDELPDQQRRQGGGVRGLRRDPALAHPAVPRPPPRRRSRAGLAGTGRDPDRHGLERPGREVRAVRRVAARPHRHAPGPGADDVRARPGRHLRPDRRAAPRPRGLPRGRRGRLRAPVLLRARRLRADPHRHRDPARSGARLAAAG